MIIYVRKYFMDVDTYTHGNEEMSLPLPRTLDKVIGHKVLLEPRPSVEKIKHTENNAK